MQRALLGMGQLLPVVKHGTQVWVPWLVPMGVPGVEGKQVLQLPKLVGLVPFTQVVQLMEAALTGLGVARAATAGSRLALAS